MFKYLSGDFAAEYNRTLKSLSEEQSKIDEKYSAIIDKMVEREKLRLEGLAPMPFRVGDKVLLVDGKVGTVVSCPVNLDVYHDFYPNEPKHGPGRFFSLNTETDETVITCDGDLRKVVVLVEADELSKDWGVEIKEKQYWPDELELVD